MTSNNTEKMVGNPSSWNELFGQLEPDSSLKTTIAIFGEKFRLLHELQPSAFAGDSASSDAYFVMLKASLLHSAIEAWEAVVGKSVVVASSPELAEELRSNPEWASLGRKLKQALTSEKLLAQFDEFSSGQSHDLLPFVGSIQNSFFHPELTAKNSSMSNPELRRTVHRVVDSVRDALDASVSKYADDLKGWNDLSRLYKDGGMEDAEAFGKAELLPVIAGHTRHHLQQRFEVELTDRRWAIIIAEVMGEDEFSEYETVIDVVSNLESYEAEYDSWSGPGSWPWAR